MGKAMPGRLPANISQDELEMVKAMEETAVEMQKEHPDKDIVEHVNGVGSARNPSEDLLLVLREPLIVRPLEDTGLSWDEETMRVAIRLHDHANPKHHNHPALRVDSSHKLCLPCHDAFNYYCRYKAETPSTVGAATEGWPNSVIHHHNFASLTASRDIFKCDLCRCVADGLVGQYGEVLTYENMQRYRVEMCWRSKKEIDKTKMFFAIVESGTTKGTYNFNIVYIMDVWSAEQHAASFDLPFAADNAYDYDMDSSTSQQLAKHWLNLCLSDEDDQHKLCNAKIEVYMPTRLLDVASSEADGMLRLIVTEGLQHEAFITLSHCWGHNEQPILTTENLEERCLLGTSIDSLPKTFQDAVAVTRWFNVKWLWLSLRRPFPKTNTCANCIADSGEDWLHEAKMMTPTYRQALLNISADATDAADSGLFRTRQPNDYVPLSLTVTGLGRTCRFTPALVFQFSWIYNAPTFERAWVHRERQLSRRVLHFTDDQMVWECCGTAGHGFASNIIPGKPLTSRAFGIDNKQHVHGLQQSRKEDLASDEEELHLSWDDICENISRKRLTVLTDMPVVLSSLAEDFAVLLQNKDQYLAGMWRYTLPRSLLWEAKQRRRRTAKLPYIAPSWSWMAVSCPTTFDARKSGFYQITYEVVEVQNIDLRYKHANDTFGPLRRGALTLQGCMRQLRFTLEGSSVDGDYVCKLFVTENGHQRLVGPHWHDYEGFLFELKCDRILEDPTLDCYCLFVSTKMVGSLGKSWTELSALLLKPDEQGEWHRIGIITFKDFYALQVRYAMTKPLTKSKTRGLWKKKHEQVREHQTASWNLYKAEKDKQRGWGGEEPKDAETDVWMPEPDPADLYAFDFGLDMEGLAVLTQETVVVL
ncbi:hypothetical protein LTR10_004416 [Elasticomyces elasticus]|nr:hypothetical protein LTR10_004416 [Elasticomyces elasticus]KAK4976733.1 hypothetical protein LTR42_002778 [Elasticomyces elasticus]